MLQRWIGPILVLLILGGVALILIVNLNLKGPNPQAPVAVGTGPGPASPAPPSGPGTSRPTGFREYPIGDEVERNQLRIAAVWLPMVQMEGMNGAPSPDQIHIEADIHATANNKNGCALDEFVPYLTVRYLIVPQGEISKTIEPIRGALMPMVARDGWHYGASISMPKAGRYRLTYTIEPPSTAGAGRHSDPVTGVDPWWKPFEVTFDWDYSGPPSS
jgi:periplasmic iron binding protein